MPALRLKAKLVFAITGMVVAIVATLAALYIFEVVHQHIQDAYTTSSVLGHEIFAVSRDALASPGAPRRRAGSALLHRNRPSIRRDREHRPLAHLALEFRSLPLGLSFQR